MNQIAPHDNIPSAQEIVQRVSAYLPNHQINGVTLEIVAQAVRRDDNWWYVPVRLNSEAPRTYQYYDLLTDIEDEIKQHDHLNVLLIPSA